MRWWGKAPYSLTNPIIPSMVSYNSSNHQTRAVFLPVFVVDT